MNTSPLRTSRLDQFANASALQADWSKLATHARMPMQDYAFAEGIASAMLGKDTINIVCTRQNGELAAVLPLCREKSFFSRWRMVGAQEVFEPMDVLHSSREALHSLCEHLAKEKRPITLDRIPADSRLIEPLKAALSGRGLMLVRPAIATPTLPLDATWVTPEDRFNAGRRSDFRRALRRAEQFGEVTFEMHAPNADEFDALFDEAIAVEVCSWKKESGSAIAVDREKEAFFRTFFRRAAAKGEVRIAFMRIDGKAVGMQMAMVAQACFWLFKIGHDEAFGKCSPGTLLMLHSLRHAAEQGLRAFELLGNTENWISLLWTREQHACLQIRIYPYGLRGALALMRDIARWLKARLAQGWQ